MITNLSHGVRDIDADQPTAFHKSRIVNLSQRAIYLNRLQSSTPREGILTYNLHAFRDFHFFNAPLRGEGVIRNFRRSFRKDAFSVYYFEALIIVLVDFTPSKFTKLPVQVILTYKQTAHVSWILEYSIALAGEDYNLIVKGAIRFKEPGHYGTHKAIVLDFKR